MPIYAYLKVQSTRFANHKTIDIFPNGVHTWQRCHNRVVWILGWRCVGRGFNPRHCTYVLTNKRGHILIASFQPGIYFFSFYIMILFATTKIVCPYGSFSNYALDHSYICTFLHFLFMTNYLLFILFGCFLQNATASTVVNNPSQKTSWPV